MADDLIDFTEASRENRYFDNQDENAPPCRAPDLAQSPVIVNSILKQCTKDNLIQLYTPVQKPVKGKLKVRFGSDSLLQTPVVKGNTCKVKASEEVVKGDEEIKSKKEVPRQLTEEEEDWMERTSVLTKQEHETYTEAAKDILHQLISEMPIKEETEPASTVGEEDEEMSPMDISECPPQNVIEESPASNESVTKLSGIELLLLQAQDCLKDYGSFTPEKKADIAAKQCSDNVESRNSMESGPCQSEHSNEKEEVKIDNSDAHINNGEEPMDCEEAMEIDDEPPPQPTMPVKYETDEKDERSNIEQEHNDVESNVIHKYDDVSEKDTEDYEITIVKKVEDTTFDRDSGNTKSDEESSPKSLECKDESEHVNIDGKIEDQTNSESGTKMGNEEIELNNGQTVDVEQKLKEETKHDSSDEEFMSADEEVEEGKQKGNLKNDEPKQDVTSEITATVAESPERIPPKVGYSMNFDDLDMVNPFACKSGVANSPVDGKSQISNSANSKLAEQVESQDLHDKEQDMDNADKKGNINKPLTEADVENAVEEKNEKFQSANTSPEKENTKPTTEISMTETSNEQREEMPQSDKTEVTPSPERIPPKVGYSIDFDSIDVINPFATKSAIQNSPDNGKSKLKSQEPETVKDKTKEDANDDSGKFNKPITESKEENGENTENIEQSTANTNSDQEETKPSEQNAPQNINTSTSEASDFNKEPREKTVGENSVISDIDPFKSKSQILNSPDKNMTECISAEDVESQTAATENVDLITESNDVKDLSDNVEEKITEEANIDTSQDSNSKNQETITLKEKQNSGTLEPEAEAPLPFDEDIPISKGVYNLDDIDFDDIDPFKPKKQMMNSPDFGTAAPSKSDDPFTVKKQLANTPTGKGCKDVTKEIENEIVQEDKKQDLTKSTDTSNIVPAVQAITDETPVADIEEIDPFKPRQQMQNSPVLNKSAEPAILDNDAKIDQFKSGIEMCNSPVHQNRNESIKNITEDNVADTDSAQKQIDDNDTEIDPFKPRIKMCNSPVHQDRNESIKNITEDNVADKESAEKQIDDNTDLDRINPFQSTSKIANSPDVKSNPQPNVDAFEDLDPFKTTNKVANSPQKEPVCHEKDDVSGVDSDKIDPFKPKNQMANSPVVDPFVTKSKIAESPVDKKVQNSKPEQEGAIEDSMEGEDVIFEIQGVARQGEQPEGATIQQFDNCLNIDEQVFVPATEVFSAPGVWDMLEQFGSTDTGKEESSLSRMSLYVKFDPLVDAAPINSRRISIRPAQLEKVKEYGLDETLLLLGTPPKKRRQSTTMSHLRNTPLGERNTPKMKLLAGEPVSSAPEGVDKILAFSPNRENEQIEKAPSSGFEAGLSLMSRAIEEQEDTGLFQELKYTDSDLRRLRSELQLGFQGGMLAKQAEWKKQEEQLEQALKAEEKRTLAVKKELTQMKEVVGKFEATFVELTDKNGQADKQIGKMKKERDQALQDVVAVENAFSDLHRRYEKMKNILVSMQQNEEVLKKTVAEHLEKKKTMDASLQSLKKKAEENITKLSKENKSLQEEKNEVSATLEARIQWLQVKLDSAEKKIEQKAEENKQLTEICDSLISKHEKHH